MSSLRMNILLEEEQWKDAVELMESKEKITLNCPKFPCPEDILEAIESGCISSLSLEKVTFYLVQLLQLKLLKWEDLPPSLINCIPLARLVVDDGQIPFDWNVLPEVCRFDVNVVLTGIKSFLIEWEEIPVHLQSNVDIRLAAWYYIFQCRREDSLPLPELPPSLNRGFFRMCIEQGKMEGWHKLPLEYRSSIDFAQDIVTFPSYGMAYDILKMFPDLCFAQETWVKLLESGGIKYFGFADLLHSFAPTEIKANRDLMLRACQFDMVVAYVDHSLRRDLSFLVSVLDLYPFQWAYLDESVRLMFPGLILSYVVPFSRVVLCEERYLDNFMSTNLITYSFWRDRINIEAWFRAGLPHPNAFLPENLPRELNADEDLMILIASHVHEKFRRVSFSCISFTLLSDKRFLEKAINLDPFLFLCASDTLQRDFDLALLAFGISVEVYDAYMRQKFTAPFQEYFLATLEAKLSAHHLFTRAFLLGIAQPQCVLSSLNIGFETSLSFKKIIAEYLDVPTGRELLLLRNCAKLRNHARV